MPKKKKKEKSEFLKFSGRKLFMCAWANEEDLINNSSDASPNEWTEPVDPVVVPCPADYSWSKGDCWVHGCTIKCTTCQDIGAHNETNCNGCNYPNVSVLWIHGCCIYSVHQTKGHNNLKNDCVPCTNSR